MLGGSMHRAATANAPPIDGGWYVLQQHVRFVWMAGVGYVGRRESAKER